MAERRARVLIVDDNVEMARTLADGLADRGYDAEAVASGREGVARLAAETFDAVVTDLRMPNVDGLELLAASRRLDPDRPVIVMTAFSAIDSAVESIHRGAYHYLTKPFKQDELAIFLARGLEEVRVRREASALKTALRARFSAASLVGASVAMQAVRERIERVADAPAPVLVLGETGTGKGLVARALHADSRRASKSFVAVNCAALPEALLESELFGYVRGAFTGATADRPGLFAEADGGSLFLDEIGEMTPGLQAKFLHALESGVVRPVGSTRERPVDVRIIAATHRDLHAAVRSGAFREDLLYRLDVVAIVVPALRDRREDIPALVEHLLGEVRRRATRSRPCAACRPRPSRSCVGAPGPATSASSPTRSRSSCFSAAPRRPASASCRSRRRPTGVPCPSFAARSSLCASSSAATPCGRSRRRVAIAAKRPRPSLSILRRCASGSANPIAATATDAATVQRFGEALETGRKTRTSGACDRAIDARVVCSHTPPS